jgi:hypothetical protein
VYEIGSEGSHCLAETAALTQQEPGRNSGAQVKLATGDTNLPQRLNLPPGEDH